MARHFATHLERRIPCPKCSKMFAMDKTLDSHFSKLHGEGLGKNWKRYQFELL
jgi:uncharacterized C2H2 Zn-finger protein